MSKQNNVKAIQKLVKSVNAGLSISTKRIESIADALGIDINVTLETEERKMIADEFAKDNRSMVLSAPAMQMVPKASQQVEPNEYGITKVDDAVNLVKSSGDAELIEFTEKIQSSSKSDNEKLIKILTRYRQHRQHLTTMLETGLSIIDKEFSDSMAKINQTFLAHAQQSTRELAEIEAILDKTVADDNAAYADFFNSFKK